MTEEWREIPDWPGYEVSSTGKVRSYWHQTADGWDIGDRPYRILKQPLVNGYPRVVLCSNGQHYQAPVHILVMLAFVGECPDGLQVCHWDGNKTNNDLENLRYDTPEANMADMKRHERRRTRREVQQIRRRYAVGEDVHRIARDYDVTEQTVYSICSGRSFPEYPGPVKPVRPSTISEISSEDIADMIALRDAGSTLAAIAARFGVSESYVCYIFQGKRLQPQFEEAQAIYAAQATD